MKENATLHTLENSPDRTDVQESEKIDSAIFAGLEKNGVMDRTPDGLVFNVQALKGWSSRNEINVVGRKVVKMDIVRTLSRTFGKAKNIETDPQQEMSPIIVLPESLEDLQSVDSNGYGQRSKKALVQPWEIGQRNNSWNEPYILQSGERANLAEMAISATLSKWQAGRNEDGRLMVTHPESGQRVPFSASLVDEFAHIKPGVTENKKLLSFDGNPLQFAVKYLPNLMERGLLRISDFRRQADSESVKSFNIHERRLNPKAPSVSLSNADGQSANYYLGRQKLVGLGIPINHNTMRVVLLDKDTAAITDEDDGGRKKIVATFPLLTLGELKPLRDSVKARLAERGRPYTESSISQNTVIGEGQMKNRVAEYSITNYFKLRSGENEAAYYKRLRPLDDPDFVMKKVAGFFQEAGIGIHNLPWSEQLVLSRALLEKNDEQKLLDFAKQYRLEGVRSFLSLDLNKDIGPKILDIGEKLEPKLAAEVFKKYSEIVGAANQAKEYANSHLKLDAKDKELASSKIREQLLKKGKDLLVQMAEAAAQKGVQLKTVELLGQLSAVKSEILLFAATYKNLPAEAKFDFEEIRGTEVEEKDSGNLLEEDKKQMREVFAANRQIGYPQKLYEVTLRDFEQSINEPGHKFRILKSDGNIIAFFHYDKVSEDALYVGSLNLHPSAKDSPIAVAMVKSSLEEYPDKNIQAVVWDKNPAAKWYGKFLKFREVGKIDDYHSSGEVYLQLERPKQKTQEVEFAEAA